MPEDFAPLLALGLMSGTSADGIDVALLATDGESHIDFRQGATIPYEDQLQGQLLQAAQSDVSLAVLLQLERELTLSHAAAVRQVLAKHEPLEEIALVGFHGHTIRHLSPQHLTFQLGDASLLAEELGVAVVADFRRRDVAAGGEGAPLTPLFHQALLAQAEKPCVVLNLGGVANITWLGSEGDILAGDVGPGCGLLDNWISQQVGKPMDRDGQFALAGRVDDDRVQQALQSPFFERMLPRSADRFEFESAIELDGLSPADGAASLCALSAEAVFRACKELPELPRQVWLTGGGAKHPRLAQELTARFATVGGTVGNIRQLGLRPDTLEAECFAWLAVRRLRGLPTSYPETTGCRHATVGGILTAPSL